MRKEAGIKDREYFVELSETLKRIMIAVAIICSVLSVTFLMVHTQRRVFTPNILISMTIDMVGTWVTLFYILGCYLDISNDKRPTNIFMICLSLLNILLVVDQMLWIIDNNVNPTAVFFSFFLNSLYYLLTTMILYLFSRYLLSISTRRAWWRNAYFISIQSWIIVLVLLMVLNVKYRFIFNIVDGVYERCGFSTVIYMINMAFMLGMISITLIQDMDRAEKDAILLFLIVQPVFTVLQLFYYGLSFLPFSMIIGASVIYIIAHIRRGILLKEEKVKVQEQQTALMLSQIQPHFLFNSLSAVVALCDINPKLAKSTTRDFSTYLERNLETIMEKAPVAFSKELKHIEAYLRIEQTRFGDRLRTEYDIKESDFLIPSLTVQPLVENAVKHGICIRPEGGKVKISTYKGENGTYVTVEDNGIGFDTENPVVHGHGVGIENIRNRLRTQSGGILTIESRSGIGTKAVVFIPNAE